MFNQVLLIGRLSAKFVQAPNLFEILNRWYFINSTPYSFLTLNFSTIERAYGSLTYRESLPNLCKDQLVVTTAISSTGKSYTNYTSLHINQNVINLSVGVFPPEDVQVRFMDVLDLGTLCYWKSHFTMWQSLLLLWHHWHYYFLLEFRSKWSVWKYLLFVIFIAIS